MKRLIPYIIGLFVSVIALTPPLSISIKLVSNQAAFVWTFLCFGFLSFLFGFSRSNPWFKALIIFLFINTFLSKVPLLSMTSFMWAVIAAYFYLACTYIEDWTPVFKCIKSVFLLQSALLTLFIFGKETLLNFMRPSNPCFGSIGNGMQFKSLMIILVAFILLSFDVDTRTLISMYLALLLLFVMYFFLNNVWDKFLYARLPVWIESIKLWKQHYIVGWGQGSFKAVFHNLAGPGEYQKEGIWMHAHNDFIQILFENGIIGLGLFLGAIISILRKARGIMIFSSLLVAYSLCFHFPIYQNTTCLIIIAFAAFIEHKTRGESRWTEINTR